MGRSQRVIGTPSTKKDGTVTKNETSSFINTSKKKSSFENVRRISGSSNKGSSSFSNVQTERERLLQTNAQLTKTQEAELKKLEAEKEKQNVNIPPVKKVNQTVGVAVSSSDLANLNQQFKEAGFSNAGEGLKGLRNKEIIKKEGSFIINKKTTKTVVSGLPKEKNKFQLLFKDGLKETKKGFPFLKDLKLPKFSFLPKKDKRLTREEVIKESKNNNIFTREQAKNRVSGPIKTVIGFTGAVGTEAFKQIVNDPIKNAVKIGDDPKALTNFVTGVKSGSKLLVANSFDPLKKSVKTSERNKLSSDLEKTKEIVGTSFSLGALATPLTSFKITGKTKINWYEQDVRIVDGALVKDTGFVFQRPFQSLNPSEGLIKGFQPLEKTGGLIKSELQSQLYPKKVDPFNLLKRPNPIVERLKGIDGAKQNPNQVKFPPTEAQQSTAFEVSELTSFERYNKLVERATAEAKANSKKSVYQREIIEYNKPVKEVFSYKGEIVKEVPQILKDLSPPKKLSILSSKRASTSTGTTFKSLDKVFEKSGVFSNSNLGGNKLKTSQLNSRLNPKVGRPQFETTIVYTTQLPFWDSLNKESTKIVIEDKTLIFEGDKTKISSGISYAQVLTPNTSSEFKQGQTLISSSDVKARIKQSQKNNSRLSSRTGTTQSLGLVTDQSIGQDQISKSKQDQILITSQKSKQVPIVFNISESTKDVFKTPQTKIPPPPPILPPKEFKTPSKSNKRGGGYNIFVREGGVFKKANIKTYSKDDAINFGADRVNRTARASFKIEESGTGITASFKGSFVPKSNFRKKNDIFIEKRSKRISTSGELREITFKGIASNRGTSKTSSKKKRRKGIFGGFL